MKKKWLLLLCLIPAFIASGLAQQPVKTKNLSLPAERFIPQSQQQPPTSATADSQAVTPTSGNSDIYNQVQREVMQNAFLAASSSDFKEMTLPPIEVLFESARGMPYMEYHALRKAEAESTKKTVKREWLRYISANTNYQYGLMAQSFSNQANSTQPTYYTYSGSAQHWWSIGATIALPFDVIFDRSNRIRRQNIIGQQADYEANTWHEEQKIKIIEAYTNATVYIQLIRIKSEASILSTQQYVMSQADFINNRMDIVELSRQKGIQNVAITEYEQTRASLYQSILKLEALSNYKILNQ